MDGIFRARLLVAIFCAFQVFNCVSSIRVKRLPNEPCMPRETLVHVEKINGAYVFPFVVKLHRCGGSCGNSLPTRRSCVVKRSEKIPVSVRRLDKNERQVIQMTNETSCACPCTIDKSQCNSETQVFNENSCRCQCSAGAGISRSCHAPFQWDASTCQCSCHLRCNHLQNLDKKSCRCKCKPEVYEECSLFDRYTHPDTCRCVSLKDIGRSSGAATCDELPLKWLAVVIVMGFVMLAILAFDCILFGRQTGIVYKLLQCCRPKKNRETDEMSNGHMLTERT